MGEAGWPALIVLIAFAFMIVGGISGWDMDAGNAFIAALVLVGIGWVVWQGVEWVRYRRWLRSMTRKGYMMR